MTSTRYQPNILVTGTPGCGKTTTCELLQRRLSDYKYYNISEFAEEHKCYDGYDQGRKSHIVDEDKLLDELEPLLRNGASIIDWHVNDIFPERLIDLVIVLRCDNKILYERLKSRGYHDSKIEENLDAEIMEVVLQDAFDSYKKEIVVELKSDSAEEMDENVDRIISWIRLWQEQHEDGVTNELQDRDKDEDEENDEDEDAIEVQKEDSETSEEKD